MDELNKRYTTLVSQYNTQIDDALTSPSNLDEKIGRIAETNKRISATLDEMLQIVTMSKPKLAVYRDELLQKLAKIQRDYDNLVSNQDKLETLRRIREFRDESWRRTLYLYLIAFLALAVLIGILILWKGGYTKETTAAMPSSAATMDAFT